MPSEFADIPDHPDLGATLRRLAAGAAVEDWEFDRILPKAARKLSRNQWTPLATARQAAAWLAAGAGPRILDVGSGVGKLCLVGALTTRGVYTGVECDPELAQLAAALARRYRVANARFLHRDAFAEDWTAYAAIYFYNPFSAGDEPAFVQAVAATRERLAALPPGTRVVVNNGFGGEMPGAFELVAEAEGGKLRLWVAR